MIGKLKKIIPASLKKQARLFLHKGRKYTCPFCSYSSKDLALIGNDLPVLIEKQVVGGGRRNGGCYNCGSSDRERLIYIYLKEKTQLLHSGKNKIILHVAPEKHLADVLLKAGFAQYICGDMFTSGYQYPAYVQHLNLLDIPYPDNTFDLIICNHVLEHIPEDLDAMKELYRVLKTGGQAILQVPVSKNSTDTFEDFSITDPKEREVVFGQFDHIRIYGQDYLNRLEEAGFNVSRVNISTEYSHYGLNIEEDIFLCRK